MDRPGEQRAHVLLAQDGGLERLCLGGRFEAELLAEPAAEVAVALEGLVTAPERVQREHLTALSALAEAVGRHGFAGVRQGRGKVELGQRQVGRVEPGAEDASLIAAAEVGRPRGVGLILEWLAAHEVERLLQ